ncbi:MAG: YopX family protein [Lentimicrobiaceae bacterium]
MRDVKFRAWDKFQQKYVFEGFHICGEVTCFGMMEQVIHETWEARAKAQNYVSTLEAWNDFEFEQFTGLTDINGKDIYEGDLVKFIDVLSSPIPFSESVNEVFWWNEYSCFSLRNTPSDLTFLTDCEVVGTIHGLPNVI